MMLKRFIFLDKKKFKNIPRNLYAVTGTNGKTSVASFFIKYINLIIYHVRTLVHLDTILIINLFKII